MWLLLAIGLHCPAMAQRISEDSCREVARQFEVCSNINPDGLAAEAPRTLGILRQGEKPHFYFICYNIYVENLFNQGRVMEACGEIKKMLREAVETKNNECQTIARRAEGQFYYKAGLYSSAADCFRKAMETCQDYKQLNSYYTYSSTATWLAQTDMHIGRLDEAEQWLKRVSDMAHWLDAEGKPDQSGYLQVRVRALMAQLMLLRKGEQNVLAARRLLTECKPFMQPALPKRAYADYYVAQMQLATLEQRNDEAVVLLDTLIRMHADNYRPICLEFVRQKAELLATMGRSTEALRAYQQYVDQKEKIDNISVTLELDKMRSEYELNTVKQDLEHETTTRILTVAVCCLLVVLLAGLLMSYVRTRRRNAILINNICEQEREREREQLQRLRDDAQHTQSESPQTQSEEDEHTQEIGQRIVAFMKTSDCFLAADYGRSTILDTLGITERQLIDGMAKACHTTLAVYANRLRIDRSVELLSKSPEMPISKVAEACGFGTIRQFQRQFKTRYGVSPSDYLAATQNAETRNGGGN